MLCLVSAFRLTSLKNYIILKLKKMTLDRKTLGCAENIVSEDTIKILAYCDNYLGNLLKNGNYTSYFTLSM